MHESAHPQSTMVTVDRTAANAYQNSNQELPRYVVHLFYFSLLLSPCHSCLCLSLILLLLLQIHCLPAPVSISCVCISCVCLSFSLPISFCLSLAVYRDFTGVTEPNNSLDDSAIDEAHIEFMNKFKKFQQRTSETVIQNSAFQNNVNGGY